MQNPPKALTLAVAGNPNCGKTTLFNALTGSDQRVGNWPGVTVEKVEGILQAGALRGLLIDLPGIYTLVPDSEDEMVARRFLASEHYDLVINIVDAANLERNLYLTTELVELGIPLVLLLNKIDVAAKNGITVDRDALSQRLGVPVFALNSTDARDVKRFVGELEALITSSVAAPAPAMVRYPEPIERFITDDTFREELKKDMLPISRRSVLLSFIEQDPVVTGILRGRDPDLYARLTREADRVRGSLPDEPDIVLAEARYGVIGELQHLITHTRQQKRRRFQLDDLVLHRIWGIPVFVAVMYAVFMIPLPLGGAFIDFFDIIFGAVFVDGFGRLLTGIGSPDWLRTFLADALGGGIQTISTFIPIIFFMFLMLSILEDSGYMARAAFVMDRFMRLIGLPGKAFVPMLIGFGCTVPAIMATRTLENRRDRFLTIFMVPFMSCGARLPVYALFAAAFFGRFAGLIVFSIYLAGILLAVVTGLVLKHTLFKGSFSPFVMELPEYHFPQPRKVMRDTLYRVRLFVFRAGKVILVAVAILTLLSSWGLDGSFGNEETENSVLSAIGKAVTPVFRPMGLEEDNWPAAVGLFTGIFAKEAIVGTLNSLYLIEQSQNSPAEPEEQVTVLGFLGGAAAEAFTVLGENLAGIISFSDGPLSSGILFGGEEAAAETADAEPGTFTILRSKFTPVAAYAYMLFVLIYFPCVAAFAAALREAGTFYGTVLVVYVTALAWVVAVLFYQIAEGHSPAWIAAAAAGYGLIILSLHLIGRFSRRKSGRIDAGAFL